MTPTSFDRPPRSFSDRLTRRPWRFVLTAAVLLGAAWQGAAMSSAPHPAPAPALVVVAAPSPAPGAHHRALVLPTRPTEPSVSGARLTPGGELSLQETLDQLGYTVNVPTEHGGQPRSRPSARTASAPAATP